MNWEFNPHPTAAFPTLVNSLLLASWSIGLIIFCVCDYTVMRDEFREDPSDVELAAGHTAILRCRPPRAEPEPRVTWKKDGVTLPTHAADRRIYVDQSGSLHVTDSRRDDSGQYTCVAENVAGQRHSAPAQLTIRGVASSLLLSCFHR